MSKILLSINPEYVENIFNGNKKYEYRKIRCKQEVDKIIIYSTSPVMQVVGEANIEKVLEDTPNNIWEITKNYSGVNIEFYKKYYKNKQKAIAYKLIDVRKYEQPKELCAYGVNYAPQSFVYLN